MASEGVTIDNNAIVALLSLPTVGVGLRAIGEKVAVKARNIVPIRTGALQASIEVIVTDRAVYVGSPLGYALWVEMGTRRMRAQPYLRPSAMGPVS